MSISVRCPHCGEMTELKGKGITFCSECGKYLPRSRVSSRSASTYGKGVRPRLIRLYGLSETERARQLGTDDWLKREAIEHIREEESKQRQKKTRRIY
jgi:hypothetical protein